VTTDPDKRPRRRRRRKYKARSASVPPRHRPRWTPVSADSPFIDETLAFWQPQSRRPLTREDAREIIENVSGFFSILLEWDAAERQATSTTPEISSGAATMASNRKTPLP
jgi:hypothetical protein